MPYGACAAVELVGLVDPNDIAGSVKFVENFFDLRMTYRLGTGVGQEILFGDIGDIFRLLVLGKQMIKGLILARAHLSRYRQPPLFCVVEGRVNIENHATKWE